jgi:hypothetical protein
MGFETEDCRKYLQTPDFFLEHFSAPAVAGAEERLEVGPVRNGGRVYHLV